MTLLKCNYLIFINLFFCYFHSYCYNFKISGKKLHLFTLFLITNHCFSLFLLLALLPFKATTITPKTFEWQVFSHGWWGLDLPILHSRITFPIVGAQQEIQCLTVRTTCLADLKSQNVSPCMTATPWRRVNWKMCNENSIFACFDAISTQFNVKWPHCGTVHDFLAVLTDPDCRHESDFSQRDGSDSTYGRRVLAVQNKTPEQISACFACIYGPP